MGRFLGIHLLIELGQVRSDTVEMFFSGSIPEAISTAQRTFKLFVVYISDTSQEAIELDDKTWSSSQVVDLITGNAIALRLVADSADASNFSAIYPVSRSPSITVVGYGGVKIWQHEGYITAEELSVKLQQAMDVFKRQMQQPALAAIASLMGGVPASQPSTSPVAASGLPTIKVGAQAATVNKPDEQAATVDKPEGQAPATVSDPPRVTVNAEAAAVNKQPDEQAAAPEEQAPTVDKPDEQSYGPEVIGVPTSDYKEEVVADEATPSSFSPQLNNERGQSRETTEMQVEPVLGTLDYDEEVKECVEVSLPKKTASQEWKVPSKILLQVKLMDGGTIRGEFEPSDDLWTVKDFVDEKQAGSSSSSSNYRFAVPFPKRVFSAADYNTRLVDLNLGSRSALILVPAGDAKPLIQRLKPGNPCSGSSSYVGSWLSYLNPFSYWRGRDEDAQTAPLSPAGTGATVASAATATPSSPTKSSSSRRRSGWGSNIHTLSHDEDEDLLKRGNKYWNGNSTQFGGKDDDKNK